MQNKPCYDNKIMFTFLFTVWRSNTRAHKSDHGERSVGSYDGANRLNIYRQTMPQNFLPPLPQPHYTQPFKALCSIIGEELGSLNIFIALYAKASPLGNVICREIEKGKNIGLNKNPQLIF